MWRMDEKAFEDTQPTRQDPALLTPPTNEGNNIQNIQTNTRKRKLSWVVFPVLGMIVLAIIAFISALGGYLSGISLRQSAENTQVALAVQEQYELGLQEMEQGEFHRAQQRFEYVIQLDPNYPGVTEKLSEVLLQLSITATPTLLPTPTITPTPDTRGNQELYDQGQQYLLNKDWKNAIETLLSLRKTDPDFQIVDVDGMLFLALRNQGVDKILKEADLEGGIYDLTLASHFGPLDAEAQGFLNWTGIYITGASFWDIDWEQAVNYFSQVAPQLPNLRDGSGMTATERLRIALYEYGNVLVRQGQACRALQLYKQSLAIAPDTQVEQAAVLAEKGCTGGGATETGKTPKPGKKTPVP
jgi:tetratricopeptide (TPR) repeat protein